MTVHEMQELNRAAVAHLKSNIRPGMPLKAVRLLCEDYLLAHGADSFWYWNVGAFVFAGDETAVSVSGRRYETADRLIGENDIVTVDLSPQRENVWGDYARTLVLENGSVVADTAAIQNREWREGLQMEEHLHALLREFVTADTTFDGLYRRINREIEAQGYVNLDFLGNLGHSIVNDKNDRIYMEKGNLARLSSVQAFTFEPHIARPGSKFGFKLENIYSFDAKGRLKEE